MNEPVKVNGPVRSHHHIAQVVSLKGLKGEVAKVQGFNAKLAVILTKGVGSMACAYLFCVIALTSLPAILVEAGALHASQVPSFLTKPGLILIVAWIAQTFIQLVLLSVIMVGQGVQSATSDARAVDTYKDAEAVLDEANKIQEHLMAQDKMLSDLVDKLAKVEARIAT